MNSILKGINPRNLSKDYLRPVTKEARIWKEKKDKELDIICTCMKCGTEFRHSCRK